MLKLNNYKRIRRNSLDKYKLRYEIKQLSCNFITLGVNNPIPKIRNKIAPSLNLKT